jgi:NAD(P)-dependent dehydrogenase (short-subunit alcohol dehydrogenase family)
METVEGRVAVVTGGASGIGLGMTRAFAGAGMRVVIADVRADALDPVVADLRASGAEAVGVPTDVSVRSEVEALATAALDSFGAVHVLCNNAGVGHFASVATMAPEDWEWILAVDLWGPIHGVTTFLPIIEREPEGHINATASIAGLLAGGLAGAYNVAKHGVVALMATLERELRAAKSSVRASVLCPGAVRTPIGTNSAATRPARPGPAAPGDARLGGRVNEALATGMDPDEVGRLVLDAIRTDTFWIFTDPRLLRFVREQTDVMIDDRALSRLKLF